MQTSRVVIQRHVFAHVGNRFLPGSVAAITAPFPFQAAKESLYRGIVPAITVATHAADYAVLLQPSLIVMAGVLTASVGMMQQTRQRFSQVDRHHQSTQQQRFFQAPVDAPTHHAWGIQVNDHGQINPALRRPQGVDKLTVIDGFDRHK